MKPNPTPAFSNEQEEAAWWDAHPDEVTDRFLNADEEGRVRRLSQTNLPGPPGE